MPDKTIWEQIVELGLQIPDSELKKMPKSMSKILTEAHKQVTEFTQEQIDAYNKNFNLSPCCEGVVILFTEWWIRECAVCRKRFHLIPTPVGEEQSNAMEIYDKLKEPLPEKAEDKLELVKELVEEGAYIDGGHHKQWFLAQIGKIIGADIEYEDDEVAGCAP